MSTPAELLQQALEAYDEQIAAHTVQRDELAEQLETLAAQLEALGVQRAKVAELLELGVGVPPADPSARPAGGTPPPTKKPKAPAAKRPGPKPDKKVCPECGRECANGTGLSAHMRSAHAPGSSVRAAATAPAPAPAAGPARPPAAGAPGRRFVCDDCDSEFDNVDRLSDHAFKVHSMRLLSAAEKAGRS